MTNIMQVKSLTSIMTIMTYDLCKSMMEKDYWKQIIFKQQKKRELMTDNIEDLPKYDMSLISSEQYAMVVQGNALLGTALKNERDSKVAMLKHIDDLEAALKNAVEMWDEETPLFDFEVMIVGIKEQFSYLFDGSTPMTGAELIAENDKHDMYKDDGAEPPEHMTADDFNEMHSGPSQPDDAGYMDGDYWW